MNINMKKLSEYDAMEGLRVIGELNRAIAPYAKDKAFIDTLRACVTKPDTGEAGFQLEVLMEIVHLITHSAPGLIIDILAIMSDSEKADIENANMLDIVDAILLLSDDVRLMDFLSKRFSLGAKEHPST